MNITFERREKTMKKVVRRKNRVQSLTCYTFED